MGSGYQLNTYVHAVEVDASGARTGREQVFGPDDDLNAEKNAWALDAITNRDVWAGRKPPLREPAPAPETTATPADLAGELAALRAQIAELQAGRQTQDSGEPKPPPTRGTGSGGEEWRAYARSVGVEVAEDASRDDVIAALAAAGKPTK